MSRIFMPSKQSDDVLQRKESRVLMNLIFVTCIIISIILGLNNFCTVMRCDTVTATITDVQTGTERYYSSKSHRYKTREVKHVYLSYSYKGESYDGIKSPSSHGNLYEQLDILVEPDDPYICYTKNQLILWPAILFFGAIFFLVLSRIMKTTSNSGNKSLSDDDDLDEYNLGYDSYEDFDSNNSYDYNDAANYDTGQVDEFLFYRETPQTKPKVVDTASDSAMQSKMDQGNPTIHSAENEISPDEATKENDTFSYEPPETVLGTYDRIYNNPDKKQKKEVDPLENYNPNDYGTDFEDLQDAYNKYFNYEEESTDDDKYDYFFKKR